MNRRTKLSFIGTTTIAIVLTAMAIPSLLPNEELSYTLKIKEGDEFVYQLNILNESLITEYRNKTVDEVVG